MKTTKKWGKVLTVGMLGMMLGFGLVAIGCKDDDSSSSSPCCTAKTWQSFADDMDATKLPTCCQTALAKVPGLLADPEITEAKAKAALGCCYNAMESSGLFTY